MRKHARPRFLCATEFIKEENEPAEKQEEMKIKENDDDEDSHNNKSYIQKQREKKELNCKQRTKERNEQRNWSTHGMNVFILSIREYMDVEKL